uniref:HMG box domain-containing protein n=1 Tax=Macrostomum lignano TaxID=282301 RepID=A0A1I8F642_9PLAT
AGWHRPSSRQARRDPQEPVNPRSAYTMFVKEKMGELGLHIRDTPEHRLKGRDQIKVVARQWRDLPSADKDAYRQAYAKASAEYEARLAAYKQTESHRLFQEKMASDQQESAKKLAAPRPSTSKRKSKPSGGAPDAQAKSVKQEEGMRLHLLLFLLSSSSSRCCPSWSSSQLQQLLPPGTVTLMAVTQPPLHQQQQFQSHRQPYQLMPVMPPYQHQFPVPHQQGNFPTTSLVQQLGAGQTLTELGGVYQQQQLPPQPVYYSSAPVHQHVQQLPQQPGSAYLPVATHQQQPNQLHQPQSQSPEMRLAVSERRDAALRRSSSGKVWPVSRLNSELLLSPVPASTQAHAMSRQMLPRVFLSQRAAERRVQPGAREFIENGDFLEFARANPQVACYLKPRRNRRRCFKRSSPTAQCSWPALTPSPPNSFAAGSGSCAAGRGDDLLPLHENLRSFHPSVQGVWTPFTFGRSVGLGDLPDSRHRPMSPSATELIQQLHRLQSARMSSPVPIVMLHRWMTLCQMSATAAAAEASAVDCHKRRRSPSAPPAKRSRPSEQRQAEPRQPAAGAAVPHPRQRLSGRRRSRPTGLHLPQLPPSCPRIHRVRLRLQAARARPCQISSARRPPPPASSDVACSDSKFVRAGRLLKRLSCFDALPDRLRLLHRYLMPSCLAARRAGRHHPGAPGGGPALLTTVAELAVSSGGAPVSAVDDFRVRALHPPPCSWPSARAVGSRLVRRFCRLLAAGGPAAALGCLFVTLSGRSFRVRRVMWPTLSAARASQRALQSTLWLPQPLADALRAILH